MKLIISHPTSNQFNRSALFGLLEENILGEFYTSVASFPGDFLDRMGGISVFSEIKRRQFQPALAPFTFSFPFFEVGRILAQRFNISPLIKHETGIFSVDSVYQQLDARVKRSLNKAGSSGINAVYAYEDGALLSFREAHRLGINCFYDLPIGYWRTAQKFLQEEKRQWPHWASTLTGLNDSESKLARKDEELALATKIFVASSFTASTLQDYPGRLPPVEVIPYGFPAVTTSKVFNRVRRGKIKLLFVGGLSQRKGLANLFSAVEKLNSCVELTVVGRKGIKECSALDEGLKRHKWISSLPHAEILKLMKQHDVLIFPSLFEGFGMVITEAMSQGTPVITTERTAGPDFIRNGENGWLVKAGSTEALQESIEQLISRPQSIAEAGFEAIKTAELRPWALYGKELAKALLKEH